MQITVGIADYAVADRRATLSSIGLGSCVAIALHSPRSRVGALAHVLLPGAPSCTAAVPSARHACTAVPTMLRRMRELGAGSDIEARIVGGASMFASLLAPGAKSLGARNIDSARAACAAHAIPVIAEDVGGAHGRSVYLDVGKGALLVRSLVAGDVAL